MTISERASAMVQEMPQRERPISEQFRIVANQYADANAAAKLMEEMKTTTLENIKTRIMSEANEPMADNKAERLAKCSDDWKTYIKDMCGHRARADKLKLQLDYIKIKHSEQQQDRADARDEKRMSR